MSYVAFFHFLWPSRRACVLPRVPATDRTSRKQLSAMQRYECIPEDIAEIAALPCTAQTPSERARQDLFQITVNLTRLRNMHARKSAPPAALITLAKSIDAALADWAASVPPEYQFTTLSAMPGQETFSGCHYLYPNLGVARTWDIYRMMRVLNRRGHGPSGERSWHTCVDG